MSSSNMIPERKPIRLPFSTRTPSTPANRATPSQIEQTICGICGKKKSNYVCPRCNVFYCSLECFRDEKHSQCSEPFYRTMIQSEISSDPNAAPEERLKMLEMLKRFEEGGASGSESNVGMEEVLMGLRGDGNVMEREEGDDEGSEVEGEELELLKERLKNVDLDSLHPDELLALLPPSQREIFLSLLNDPDSEGTKDLLQDVSKEEEERGWWVYLEDGPSLQEEEEHEEEAGKQEEVPQGGEAVVQKKTSSRKGKEKERGDIIPDMIQEEHIAGISISPRIAGRLIYNVFAVCLSYIHLLRYHLLLPSLNYHLSRDPPTNSDSNSPSPTLHSKTELVAFRSDLSRSVPFLEDQKSSVRLGSVGTVVELSRGYLSVEGESPASILHSLETLLPLLSPSIDLSTLPRLSLLLSDIHRFYTSPIFFYPGKDKPSGKALAAAKKIAFYIVVTRVVERKMWRGLMREVEDVIDGMKGASEEDAVGASREGLLIKQEGRETQSNIGKIVELS